MTGKPIVPRRLANRDIQEAVDDYARQAGERVALGFVDALQSAFRDIAEHPALGSARYAHELGLPGLRSRSTRRYPYMVFYVEHADHIDVWRVLHAHRDIPTWLVEPKED